MAACKRNGIDNKDLEIVVPADHPARYYYYDAATEEEEEEDLDGNHAARVGISSDNCDLHVAWQRTRARTIRRYRTLTGCFAVSGKINS